jgi:NADH-quinone oxidoreductase subunit F
MPGTTICGLADGAAWPIKNALTKFRGELEDHIRTVRSSAHQISPLQEEIAAGRSPDSGASAVGIINRPSSSAALTAPDGRF